MRELIDIYCELMKECDSNGLRIGQVMSNVFDLAAKDSCDPFFIENDKLIEYLKKYTKS